MWEQYLRDMKDALRREQTRFTRDMERLRGDLDHALLNQEAARAELLRIAALAGRAPERPPPDSRADRLISAWCAEESDNDAQSILRRAMAATGDMPSVSPTTGTAGPPPGLHHVPPPGHMDVDAFMNEVETLAGQSTSPPPPAAGEASAFPAFGVSRPPDANAYAGPATRDPYLPSPGQTALRERAPSVSPRPRPGPYARADGDAASHYGGPVPLDPLAAALAATRAATPFGTGAPPMMGNIRPIDPSRRPVPTLIEDDDELNAPPDPGGAETHAGA